MGEQYEMSEMDTSDMSEGYYMSETPATVAKVPPETDGTYKWMVIGGVLLLSILLLLGIGAYTYTKVTRGAQVGGESDSGTPKPGVYVAEEGAHTTKSIATATNKPTKHTPRKTTTLTNEGTDVTSETADNFVELSTSDRAIPKPLKASSDVLICTVSHRALSPIQYPPDGLCDVLFYADVYYDGNKKSFRGSYDIHSFDLFRTQARSSTATSRTAHGVSFNYQYARRTSTALNDKTAQDKFSAMWKDKICHYGILHAWDNPPVLKNANEKLALIKEVKKQTDAIKGDTKVELAIGFQFLNGNHLSQTKEVADFIQKNYPITILVAITHLFKKKRLDQYNYSNGPTTWDGCYTTYNKKTDCPHLMKAIAEQLKKLQPQDNIAIMVSFTMAAAYWKLEKRFYETTNKIHFESDPYWRSLGYTQVEHMQKCFENYTEPQRYDKRGHYFYTGSKKTFFALTFDTYESLQRKMELYVDTMGARPGRQGWAVYDVDFDDYTNACKYSTNFKNLRTVSRFVHL